MINLKDINILNAAQNLIIHYGYSKVTMTDVAEAVGISRPTLYKSYANKEAIVEGLLKLQVDNSRAQTLELIASSLPLKAKLENFFDIWTIKPSAPVIGEVNGRDMLTNVAQYAPAAVNAHYREFEAMLTALLKPELKQVRSIPAEDLARILGLAARGLKASSGSLEELRRLIDGLISLTVAGIEK